MSINGLRLQYSLCSRVVTVCGLALLLTVTLLLRCATRVQNAPQHANSAAAIIAGSPPLSMSRPLTAVNSDNHAIASSNGTIATSTTSLSATSSSNPCSEQQPGPPLAHIRDRISNLTCLIESYKSRYNAAALEKLISSTSTGSDPVTVPTPEQQQQRQQQLALLCNMKFIVSKVACRDAGNGLGIFLDNFAWAVALDRPLIAVWNTKTNYCNGSLVLHDWVPTWSSALLDRFLRARKLRCSASAAGFAGSRDRTTVAGISTSSKKTANSSALSESPSSLSALSLSSVLQLRSSPDQMLACCHIASIDATLMSPGTTSKLGFMALTAPQGRHGANVRHKQWDDATQQRISILFSHPSQLASFETYGVLTMHGVRFTAAAQDAVRNVLARYTEPAQLSNSNNNNNLNYVNSGSNMNNVNGKTPIVFAAHIRHQKMDSALEEVIDDAFGKCLAYYIAHVNGTAMVSANSGSNLATSDKARSLSANFDKLDIDKKSNSNSNSNSDNNISTLKPNGSPTHTSRECVFLVATDRIATMHRMQRVATSLGCSAQFVERDMRPEVVALDRDRRGEHGPWGESATSVADLFLLSHADYFIGTKVSSYSTLIANNIAARRALVKRPSDGGRVISKDSVTDGSEPYMWGLVIHEVIRAKENGAKLDVALACGEYRDRRILEPDKTCSDVDYYYDMKQLKCVSKDLKIPHV